MAPEANLIAIKASDDAGNSTVLDVINGIAFAVDHKQQFNIRVLNMSLSTDTPQSYKTDPLDAAVEYAWQKGIVVVAASGNRGTAADAVQYAPANDPYVISVGGVDETGNNGAGKRADWSSVGTHAGRRGQAGGRGSGRAHRVRPRPEQRVHGRCARTAPSAAAYFKAGGTSMAAPVVAGAAALLLQARPTLTPDQVKALLMGTDKYVVGNNAGAGMIDVERALYTQTYQVPAVNRYLQPNQLIDCASTAAVTTSAAGPAPPGARRPAPSAPAGPARAGPARTCTGHGRRDRPAAFLLEPQHLVERRRGRQRRGRAVRCRPAEEAEETGSLDAPIPTDAVTDRRVTEEPHADADAGGGQ